MPETKLLSWESLPDRTTTADIKACRETLQAFLCPFLPVLLPVSLVHGLLLHSILA